MQNIGLKDIAEIVDVSVTSVSKVLNGYPIRISNSKRANIIETAERLGYKPNMVARGLKSRKTKSVGIVIPDMSTLFYPELLMALETWLSARGYQTFICNSEDDLEKEKSRIDALMSRSIDGLIVAPAAGDGNIPLFKQIQESRAPFLLLDRYYAGEGLNYIVTDNKSGAILGVNVLASMGASKLVYLGGSVRNQSLQDRLEGVYEGAARSSLHFDDAGVFLARPDRASIKATADRIFESCNEGAGVFLESNRYLMGLLDAAGERSLKIPNDLLVAGFDSFRPNITSAGDFAALGVIRRPIPIIKQDTEKMAELACEYLISGLVGGKNQNLQMMLPVQVING
ncbi:MAG: LacI family DNA-binding transcriptional regulator [Armatimonadota bacterium]